MLKTSVIGYIGRTAETRTLQNGDTATSFSVAHTERYTTKEGELKENTTWLNCTMWNAGGVKDWLKQGTQVYAEGYPSMRTYETREGGTGISFELRIGTVQLLNNPKEKPATDTSTATGDNAATQTESTEATGATETATA